jgi:hypothetical protein
MCGGTFLWCSLQLRETKEVPAHATCISVAVNGILNFHSTLLKLTILKIYKDKGL